LVVVVVVAVAVAVAAAAAAAVVMMMMMMMMLMVILFLFFCPPYTKVSLIWNFIFLVFLVPFIHDLLLFSTSFPSLPSFHVFLFPFHINLLCSASLSFVVFIVITIMNPSSVRPPQRL
jgi:hypothetical protein